MKLLPNLVKILLLMSVFCASPIFAESGLKVTTIDDFQKWVETRILCQKTPYKTKENDMDFGQKMKALGFVPKINLDEESGIYDGKVLIQKPMIIHGFLLKEISFYMDSGIGFYALVEASSDDLTKLIKDKKLNKYSSKRSKDHTQYVFPTSKPDSDGLTPEGIVINKTKNKNINQIGCQQFDY